jgi:hypothetical protein
MASFGEEVKPSVPCRRFAACKKTPAIYVEVGIAGKIDRPFRAQFSPSLIEVSVAWRGAPLEMTGGTKGGAQRASSLRPRCVGEVDPETATLSIYLSIYLSTYLSIYRLWSFAPTPAPKQNELPGRIGTVVFYCVIYTNRSTKWAKRRLPTAHWYNYQCSVKG